MKAKTIQQLKLYWSILWKLLFVGIFIYIGYTQIMKASSTPIKIAILCISIIVLLFFIYNEFIQHLFRNVLYELTMNCDVNASKQALSKLKKYDIGKGLSSNHLLLEALYLMDELDFDSLKELLERETPYFKSSPEALLIYYYSLLKIAAYQKNTPGGKLAYEKCNSLLNSKIKGKKLHQVFSKLEVEGLFAMSANKNKAAHKEFSKVDMANMNAREQVQLLYFHKLAASRIPDKNKVESLRKTLSEYEGTSEVLKRGKLSEN